MRWIGWTGRTEACQKRGCDRKFAPYLGVVYEGKFGQTANFARAAGESTGDVRFVFGVRLWF
jgi:uncharacterized protein involved in copper resistance